MESNVTRLQYVLLLCVCFVICRILWDSGLLNNSNIKPLNTVEDWMNLAPSVMSLQSAASSVELIEKTIRITESKKKKAVEETALRSRNENTKTQQLTPEQEEQLKDLIDFSLGDEIEREDLGAEEIQGMLNLAIADAQQAYAKVHLRRRR